MKPIKDLSIVLASDHAGYRLKLKVIEHLKELGCTQITDCGCYSTESCDYPDFAHPMATAVETQKADYGIAICSTGNGINMTANHHQGIRAALCWMPELAKLAREHNNANVLTLPANYISEHLAYETLETFFATDFAGGRHQRRIAKIPVK